MVFHFSSSFFYVTCFVQSSAHTTCVYWIFFPSCTWMLWMLYFTQHHPWKCLWENLCTRENVYKCLDLNITAYTCCIADFVVPLNLFGERKKSASVWMVEVEEMKYGKCWWVYDSQTLCKHCCFMHTLFKWK